MKIDIGNYRNFIGPYQISEKILFWMDKYEDERVHAVGDFLAHGFRKKTISKNGMLKMRDDRGNTWFYSFLLWIDSKKKRKTKIRIDYWDTWNIDMTLSPIILPLLKQLQKSKHSSGMVDLEDVPVHMRTTDALECYSQRCFDFCQFAPISEYNVHTRYEWLLDEIIWTFEQLQPESNWEEQYDSRNYADRAKHQERISNGLALFGKYFQTLWD